MSVDACAGKPLADERLLPEVGAIFMAGFDTSGHTATWALFLVSQHPEVRSLAAVREYLSFSEPFKSVT